MYNEKSKYWNYKLNKNIKYVQGMNELVSIIYFVILQEKKLAVIMIIKLSQLIIG